MRLFELPFADDRAPMSEIMSKRQPIFICPLVSNTSVQREPNSAFI